MNEHNEKLCTKFLWDFVHDQNQISHPYIRTFIVVKLINAGLIASDGSQDQLFVDIIKEGKYLERANNEWVTNDEWIIKNEPKGVAILVSVIKGVMESKGFRDYSIYENCFESEFPITWIPMHDLRPC